MQSILAVKKIGRLQVYVSIGETLKEASFLRKLFPKNTYRQIVAEAKEYGIMNAAVYGTQLGYTNNQKLAQFTIDSDNSRLTVCIELIDEREKLETFYLKYKTLLKNKVAILSDVECWQHE